MKNNPTMKRRFMATWFNAKHAGIKAGEDAIPTPMTVTGGVRGPDGKLKVYHVPDGPCGFAWVVIRPGNCAFANWLKKRGFASKHYGGGVSVWIGEFNQSLERKTAMAGAMAKVFSEAGHNAYAGSRMD